jgi:hypothetical protein
MDSTLQCYIEICAVVNKIYDVSFDAADAGNRLVVICVGQNADTATAVRCR